MDRFRYCLVRSTFWLLSRLPLPLAQGLGAILGYLAGQFPNRARETTRINLALAFPDWKTVQRRQLERASLSHTGRTILEMPWFWERSAGESLQWVKTVEGQSVLSEAAEAGKGVILLSPHLGNWELAGLYFASRFPMTLLYSPPNRPHWDRYLRQVRGRTGAELAGADRAGVRKLLRRLRNGGLVGLLPDQSPRPSGGVHAPFFGIPVRTMTLAGRLAHRSGAIPLLTYAERLPAGQGFRIVIRRTPEALADPDPETATSALNQALEACIRALPAQYQWEYKRFRHQPEGLKNPYKR